MARRAIALFGDWNADPRTDKRGTYSPFWLARKAGLQLWLTGPGRHGLIDFAMSSGDVELVQRRRLGNGAERAHGRGSDHDAIGCVVKRPDGVAVRVLFWNVERDRPVQTVLDQLVELVGMQRPDVVVLQEAAQYVDRLRRSSTWASWRIIAGREQVDSQNVLMIGPRCTVSGERLVQLTPEGWITETGAVHGPLYAPSALVDGWLRVVGVHLPPSVNWSGPVIHGPIRRVACYVAAIRRLRTWVQHWKAEHRREGIAA